MCSGPFYLNTIKRRGFFLNSSLIFFLLETRLDKVGRAHLV